MRTLEVFPWPAFTFIVLVVILLRFTAMVRTLKAMTNFAAVTATACFSSLTPMKPVSRALKEQITEMAVNGAGVRDTARVLKIGINTVIRTLKNSRQSE